MAYKDQFDREIELDLDEATELVVRSVMREGELQFRDALIEWLEKDIKEYLSEVDGEPNQEWIDGVRYVIHIVREGDLDAQQ